MLLVKRHNPEFLQWLKQFGVGKNSVRAKTTAPRSFFSHPDFNRRHLNFTDSTAASLDPVAWVLLANQMADATGRGL
jgi:hypothetical protein